MIRVMEYPVQGGRRKEEANPLFCKRRDLMGSTYGCEVIEAELPRKASREELARSYPKPTQVGWLSRLR